MILFLLLGLELVLLMETPYLCVPRNLNLIHQPKYLENICMVDFFQ